MKVYFIIEDETIDADTLLNDCEDAKTFADVMNNCSGVSWYADKDKALRHLADVVDEDTPGYLFSFETNGVGCSSWGYVINFECMD